MRSPLPLFKSERTLCCVFGCNSRLNFKTNDVTLFHQLPFAYSKDLLIKWVNAIKLPQRISKHMMVCSRHFKQEDYTRIDGVKELKPEAVPSENLPHVWRNKFHPRDYGRLIKILEYRGIGRLRLCFEAKLARQIRKAEQKRKEKKLKDKIDRQRIAVSEEKSNKEPQRSDSMPTIISEPFSIESVHPVINQEHSLTSEIDIKEEPLSDNENEETIHEEETVEEMLAKMNEETVDDAQEQMLDNGTDKLGFEHEESLWDSLMCNICGEEDCEGHEEDKFECAPCGKQFRTSRQLNAHNLSHFEYRRRGHPFDKEAVCKVCNKVLSTKVSLNEHMLSHSNDKQYVCMLCDKPFRHKASLVMHINSHTIHPNHRCKMCGVCFSDAEELDRHVRKHKVLMREYTCRECGQQFRSKQACWAHLNSHMRAKSKPGLSCDVCGRVLSTKATLKEHMFIHSGEKPFECQLCGRKIRHRANFIIHVQGHSLGQPHLCSLCGMGFAKKSELCSHTAAEHPEDKPFLCIICGMRFRTETRFFRHAISHSDLSTSRWISDPSVFCDRFPNFFSSNLYFTSSSLLSGIEPTAMHNKRKLCDKLTSSFLRKWWVVIVVSLILIFVGIFIAIFFNSIVNLVIDKEITLREGGQVFEMWRKPPVEPVFRVYVYNVTNADDFLNRGDKPILDELGPFVYVETWEKVNLTFNENGTVTFQQQKIYKFDPEQSVGDESDMVIVPNIPMLSATSQSKHAARFLRLAMASIMDILKIKPFVEVSVGQLLWGYEDPLLKLAKDVVPKEQKLPYEEFGLLYGKNGTSKDIATVFTGANDITKFGLVDRWNGMSHLPHWKSEECNSLAGSDGSIFPPHITKNTTLYVFDKDLCRLLPLKFKEEVDTPGNVLGYRFSPPDDVFADIDQNPANECFCPSGPPCSPNGLFNVSLCQYDSPIMLSFPHFYLADPKLRTAVEGISEPDPEKHSFWLDVQPTMGAGLRAQARIQINLAVSQVVDIKQVATFPDIVFPIMWFEEGISGLPESVTKLMNLATTIPPILKTVLLYVFFIFGLFFFVLSAFCLVRNSQRQETLSLEGTAHYAANDEANKKAKQQANGQTNGHKFPDTKTNPAFVGDQS